MRRVALPLGWTGRAREFRRWLHLGSLAMLFVAGGVSVFGEPPVHLPPITEELGTTIQAPVQGNWQHTARQATERRPDLLNEMRRDKQVLIGELGSKPMQAVTTNIRPSEGRVPSDSAGSWFAQQGTLMHGPGTIRPWGMSDFRWEAAALGHRPLYFEEINLERHGHQVRFIQPLVSAFSFFGRVLALPYLMAMDPPYECQYALGHGRPGSCEPYPIRGVPVLAGPSVVQAAVLTALIFAIP